MKDAKPFIFTSLEMTHFILRGFASACPTLLSLYQSTIELKFLTSQNDISLIKSELLPIRTQVGPNWHTWLD